MSSKKCFKDGCTGKLYGKCECQGIVLFCKKHYVKHAKTPSSKGHQCIRSYFEPAEEIKQPIMDMLKKFKQDIKICRADAISEANNMIKSFGTEFEKYIRQINEVEVRCNEMIKILLSGEKVLDIYAQDEIESVLKLNASNIDQMIGWSINEYYLKCNEINREIKNIFIFPFNPFRQYQNDIIYSDELSFFRDNSKDFVTINLSNFHISSSITLPTEESISWCACSCILPDKTYFYCCNGNTNSGYTFTIDKNKNIKKLQNSKVNCYVDPIFYNDFIYLIGGQKKLAERYNFEQNIWETMAPVNQNLNFTYGCNAL